MRMRILAAAALAAAAASGEDQRAMTTYCNPILPVEAGGGADPAVLRVGDEFFFYSTNPGNHVFRSRDLVRWEQGPQVMPDEFRGLWAPEVYHHPEDGRYYLYYTMRYKIGVAVADRPDGRFEDLGYLVVDAIDAHPFRDDDGRLYLYFTHTPKFEMYCVPMKGPTQPGGPIVRCFEISQDWERHSFPINEGPWMLKRDGVYYLLYSGSDGQSIHYAVGYATAPTPIGPFTKYERNPIFQNLPAVNGPGHGSVIADRSGRLWHLYHQKTGVEKGWRRDICLDPLEFDESGALSGTPTRGTQQPPPDFDPGRVWAPEIRPRGAVFEDRVAVRISCDTPGAEIRYTRDGREPDAASPLYTAPIEIGESCTVRARAFKAGQAPSSATRQKFTRGNGPMARNPAPNADPGHPPLLVFPEPVKDWKPLADAWKAARP